MPKGKKLLQDKILLQGIDKDIEKLLYQYVKVESYTYSKSENEASTFLEKYFSEIDYFRSHREFYGNYSIAGDPFERSVFWAMVKGKGSNTIVLIHHYDIVDVEDFKDLKHLAFSPRELKEALLEMQDSLSSDSRKDLLEDTFMFGRGTADMKAGGAIQIELMRRYSRLTDFEGNIIMLALPDEENMSAGMRAGVELLSELKKEYALSYRLMINSEPHQRRDFTKGVFSEGSVGKIMPFIYVRGYLAHIGKVFEGLNPLNVLSRIAQKTELNMSFSDTVAGEAAPPPTWLHFKDSKNKYDVSMPMSAEGCFSVLTLDRSPEQLMGEVRRVCTESFAEVIEEMNESYSEFMNNTGRSSEEKLPWSVNVKSFAELYQEAKEGYGENFEKAFRAELSSLAKKIAEGETNIVESNFTLINYVYNYIDDRNPRVIYGLLPPYYPSVSNLYLEEMDERQQNISGELTAFVKEEFGQDYEKEMFYTGISDLSFAGVKNAKSALEPLAEAMPLYGRFYSLPVDAIEDITMPVINIGPWGKDFHKLTERVNIQDLYERTPRIICWAIDYIL